MDDRHTSRENDYVSNFPLDLAPRKPGERFSGKLVRTLHYRDNTGRSIWGIVIEIWVSLAAQPSTPCRVYTTTV